MAREVLGMKRHYFFRDRSVRDYFVVEAPDSDTALDLLIEASEHGKEGDYWTTEDLDGYGGDFVYMDSDEIEEEG
jgi:hypothetical protein